LTIKADFTEEEWNQILQAPILVGFYVIFSDPNFLGMFNEFKALFKTIFEQPIPDAASEFVTSIVEDIDDRAMNPEELPDSDKLRKDKLEYKLAKMLGEIEDVAILIEAKASPQKAAGFKVWLFGVAKGVSEASKEDSRFGFGGELVSKKEKRALNKLKFVLRI
jgi:hypothetical protein